MAESQGASVDSKPRGADMTAPPLRAHHVASVRVADLEICPIDAAVSANAAALEENQVVNEDQALQVVDQNVMTGVTRRNEDLNREGLLLVNSRASLGEFFPRLDVGDAKYQSLLEAYKLLQKQNKDLEEAGKHKDEEIRGLNEQVRIQAGVITGLTCCRH